jgi:hypothetical protein
MTLNILISALGMSWKEMTLTPDVFSPVPSAQDTSPQMALWWPLSHWNATQVFLPTTPAGPHRSALCST